MQPRRDSRRSRTSHVPSVSRVSMVALVVAAGVAGTATAAAAQEPDGSALFTKHCRACHGPAGVPASGMMKMFPGLSSLADSAFLAARSADSIISVLNNGAGGMRPFKGKLTAEEMTAVAQFVKGLATATAEP